MAEQSIPLKQCARKENCENPEQIEEGWLPATADYFPVQKDTDYLTSRCKICLRNWQREYRKKHPERIRASQTASYYKDIEKSRERSRVYARAHPEKEWGRSKKRRAANPEHMREVERRSEAKHREERNARVRQRRSEHVEEERARNRLYKKEHPEIVRAQRHKQRAIQKLAKGTHGVADVRLQIRSQTDKKGVLRCWWCGKAIGNDYHVDHRIPLDRGGSNAPGNLVITHPYCNESKGAKLPQEWNGRLL